MQTTEIDLIEVVVNGIVQVRESLRPTGAGA
jgi:hypothetical protein